MPTFIYSKKDFIKFVENQVNDKEVIVFTNEMAEISTSKKKGLKIVHVYAPDAFKDEGVGHIAFGKSQPFGLIIVKEELLSELSKKAKSLQS